MDKSINSVLSTMETNLTSMNPKDESAETEEDWTEKDSFSEDPDSTKNREPTSIQFLEYWKGPLTFGYYFLIIPFRIRRSKRTAKLEIATSRFQKVLCGIVQFMLLLEFLSLFWTTYEEAKGSNIGYFTSATYIGYVAYHLSLNYTFWFKQDVFRTLFHQIQSIKFYSEMSREKTNFLIRLISFSFCASILLLALTDSSIVNYFYAHGGNIEKFYEYLSKKTQLHVIFIDAGESGSLTMKCLIPIMITIIRIFTLLPSIVLVPFLDLFVLMVPYSIWRMMCAFEVFCKNTAGSPSSSIKIMEKYWAMKKLLQQLNRAIGLLLCCCVSVSLPYYAAWTGVTYFESNVHPVMLLHVYGFFLLFFIALTLAADINKKGCEFFSWISSPKNSKDISNKTLTSLLVDLHSNQIALKGNGFFQISYRFLGTIFGVIVTYSIITIQIQLSRKNLLHKNEMKLPHNCYCNESSILTENTYEFN